MTQGVPNPYGIDLQSLPNSQGVVDLDPGMIEGSGRMLLAQSLVRRFTTPRGSVIDAPNDCLDVRSFLSAGFTQAQINGLSGTLKAEAEKDERVVNADVQATYQPSTRALTITMAIQSGYGPFSLTLSLINGQVTVSVLQGS